MTRRKMVKSSLSTAALVATGTAARAADYDVVVVGAGAAGLAATDSLLRSGASVVCIEAADRIGGRVHTNTSIFGIPFDTGAHWLHNRSLNPFVDFGKKLGLDIYRAPSNFVGIDRNGIASDAALKAFENEANQIASAIGRAARQGRDVAAAEVIKNPNAWTLTAMAHIGSLSMARDMKDVSTADWYSAESGQDWFCREGFGTLLARLWANVPVQLNTTVSALDTSADRVSVTTKAGNATAKAAIVTVSQGVLAHDDLTFGLRLDQSMQSAIQDINMGSYNHIVLQFETGAVPTEPDSWIAYELTQRANGGPKGGGILANIAGTDLSYFEIGGSFGKSLERQGKTAMIDFALEEMTNLFGSNLRKQFKKGYATQWGKYRFTHGAYSGANPAKADLRKHLLTPIGERIFLAGEATSFGEQATVSGAHKEGLRAANQVLKLLR